MHETLTLEHVRLVLRAAVFLISLGLGIFVSKFRLRICRLLHKAILTINSAVMLTTLCRYKILHASVTTKIPAYIPTISTGF